tara:strand:+ start:11138 stop:11605 length:468 start_codon:yes stop_codon:yes gene_type:complete
LLISIRLFAETLGKEATMKINEIMQVGCQTIGRQDSVQRAAQMMQSEQIGSIPVAEDDRLVGMVTDRDIVTRSVAANQAPDQTQIGSVMSDGIRYCYADQECDDVAKNMSEVGVRRMPVVDRDKSLVGMVSLGDIANRASAGDAGQTLAGLRQQS